MPVTSMALMSILVRRKGIFSGNLSRVMATLKQGCQMAKFYPFLSLDCARVEGTGAQSKERKGSNFAAQRGGAIVQKPEGPNTYNLKRSGHQATRYETRGVY